MIVWFCCGVGLWWEVGLCLVVSGGGRIGCLVVLCGGVLVVFLFLCWEDQCDLLFFPSISTRDLEESLSFSKACNTSTVSAERGQSFSYTQRRWSCLEKANPCCWGWLRESRKSKGTVTLFCQNYLA